MFAINLKGDDMSMLSSQLVAAALVAKKNCYCRFKGTCSVMIHFCEFLYPQGHAGLPKASFSHPGGQGVCPIGDVLPPLYPKRTMTKQAIKATQFNTETGTVCQD